MALGSEGSPPTTHPMPGFGSTRRCREGDACSCGRSSSTAFLDTCTRLSCKRFRLRGPDMPSDVFQDVFLKAYENLSRLRDDTAVRPWLAQLTRRTCLDRLRAGQHELATRRRARNRRRWTSTLSRLDEAMAVREAPSRIVVPRRFVARSSTGSFARDESYRADRRGARDPRRTTIASRILALPGQASQRVRGKKHGAWRGWMIGDQVTDHEIERLAELLRALPPPPAAWVQAAQELPLSLSEARRHRRSRRGGRSVPPGSRGRSRVRPCRSRVSAWSGRCSRPSASVSPARRRLTAREARSSRAVDRRCGS